MVLAYRIISLSQAQEAVQKEAKFLTAVLDWAPAKITSLLYLLVGNFQAGFQHFSRLILAGPAHNNTMLSVCGLSALGSDEPEPSLMPRAEILVEHAVIVLLVLLAILQWRHGYNMLCIGENFYLSNLNKRAIMPVILRMVVIFLMVFLSGCVHRFHSNSACTLNCQHRLNVCNQACDNNCLSCAGKAHQIAAKTYGRYRNEQCVRGGRVVRELQSYRDPLQCRKITCECMADYQLCIQSCTGVIRKQLQIPPTCC